MHAPRSPPCDYAPAGWPARHLHDHPPGEGPRRRGLDRPPFPASAHHPERPAHARVGRRRRPRLGCQFPRHEHSRRRTRRHRRTRVLVPRPRRHRNPGSKTSNSAPACATCPPPTRRSTRSGCGPRSSPAGCPRCCSPLTGYDQHGARFRHDLLLVPGRRVPHPAPPIAPPHPSRTPPSRPEGSGTRRPGAHPGPSTPENSQNGPRPDIDQAASLSTNPSGATGGCSPPAPRGGEPVPG